MAKNSEPTPRKFQQMYQHKPLFQSEHEKFWAWEDYFFREHGYYRPYLSPPANDRVDPCRKRLEEFSQFFRLADQEDQNG